MTRETLIRQIRTKQSYLCIGLDTDITKLPSHLLSEADPVFEFNKAIIDATRDLCVSYKINTAFYEANGVSGWQSMEKTVNYLGEEHFRIADAKRGDIGNTSDQYARAFFETLPFDAITVAPYMGEDSVTPFLQYPGKWAIVLGLTSNKGSDDFQKLGLWEQERIGPPDLLPGGAMISIKAAETLLYQQVLLDVARWGKKDNLMFVIGATHPDDFIKIRNLVPHHFFLVPGVGAQGGSLRDISEKAMNGDIGILVNVSRAIIYADNGLHFAEAARKVALAYQQEMAGYIR